MARGPQLASHLRIGRQETSDSVSATMKAREEKLRMEARTGQKWARRAGCCLSIKSFRPLDFCQQFTASIQPGITTRAPLPLCSLVPRASFPFFEFTTMSTQLNRSASVPTASRSSSALMRVATWIRLRGDGERHLSAQPQLRSESGPPNVPELT